MKQITIPVYSDPGHSWMKVSRKLLTEFGVDCTISAYSYQRGNDVFLEEDLDGPRLVEKLKEAGVEVKFKGFYTDRRSKIRNYDSYFMN